MRNSRRFSMTHWRCAAMAPLLALALLPAVRAQDGAAPPATTSLREVDLDARALIDRFREAIKSLRDLSCTVEQRQTEGDEPGELATGSVALTFERAPNGVGIIKKFRIARDAAATGDGKQGAASA